MDKKYYFFDLDGTVTESGEGIMNSARYALTKLGYPVPDEKTLREFIGPPLHELFMKRFGMDDEGARHAISVYREYYKEKGIFENKLYDGIKELLEKIAKSGDKKALICTSKPEIYTHKILDSFGVKENFHFIAGAVIDGIRATKPEIIKHILDTLSLNKDECVMIGDTKFDVLGAKELGITSIGVLYGYGTRESIEAAGADYVVETVSELSELIFD